MEVQIIHFLLLNKDVLKFGKVKAEKNSPHILRFITPTIQLEAEVREMSISSPKTNSYVFIDNVFKELLQYLVYLN